MTEDFTNSEIEPFWTFSELIPLVDVHARNIARHASSKLAMQYRRRCSSEIVDDAHWIVYDAHCFV